ncbi:MAG: hypothetical protein O3B64_00545 [bacterium]|nr:hypothetical protein [bacterium]
MIIILLATWTQKFVFGGPIFLVVLFIAGAMGIAYGQLSKEMEVEVWVPHQSHVDGPSGPSFALGCTNY